MKHVAVLSLLLRRVRGFVVGFVVVDEGPQGSRFLAANTTGKKISFVLLLLLLLVRLFFGCHR